MASNSSRTNRSRRDELKRLMDDYLTKARSEEVEQSMLYEETKRRDDEVVAQKNRIKKLTSDLSDFDEETRSQMTALRQPSTDWRKKLNECRISADRSLHDLLECERKLHEVFEQYMRWFEERRGYDGDDDEETISAVRAPPNTSSPSNS